MHKLIVIGLVVILMLAVTPLVSGAQATKSNDAWIPGLASFLVPGLGQWMNDQPDKAIMYFGVDVAIWIGGGYIASIMPIYYWYEGYSLVGLAHLAWSLYCGYDAYTVAKEKGFTLGFNSDGLTLAYNF